jgi:ABC-type multidrug transport system fused ATPase/permease subunit
VRFEDVWFSYEGGEPHLDDVSLAVKRGEVAAFVGASGSGKSTALRMLLGLHAPQSGRILVGGVDLQRIPLGEYWSHVSAVFQDSLLFNTSIADNVRAGRLDASDAEVAAAARAAEIDDWIDSLPDGYATIVAGDTCSGGQRQRIALARALVRDPELLVLDEPTSALDAATGAAVMETLRRIAPGRTVVLVTHQLRDAAAAAQIVVFEDGRVAETGTHAELLMRDGVYASLWQRQRDAAPAPGTPAAPA